MERAINQINENRKTEAERRAANTPTPEQLAELLLQSKQKVQVALKGRVPLPVQVHDA